MRIGFRRKKNSSLTGSLGTFGLRMRREKLFRITTASCYGSRLNRLGLLKFTATLCGCRRLGNSATSLCLQAIGVWSHRCLTFQMNVASRTDARAETCTQTEERSFTFRTEMPGPRTKPSLLGLISTVAYQTTTKSSYRFRALVRECCEVCRNNGCATERPLMGKRQ